METKTDEEGYFSFNLPVTQPLGDAELWHAITQPFQGDFFVLK